MLETTLIVTHRARKIRRHIPLTNDEVLEGHLILYDSPNQGDRMAVVLENLPLLDATGREIRVYSETGQRVSRQAGETESIHPCGILVDIRSLAQEFSVRPATVSFRNNDRPVPRVTGYPQAFLTRYGHLQARGGIPFMDGLVRGLNRQMGDHGDGSDDEGGNNSSDDDDDDDRRQPSRLPVLEAIQCQFYNHLSHRTRASSPMHCVQKGIITSMLGGAYAHDRAGKRKAKNLQDYCKLGLPHERFEAQIREPVVGETDVGETVPRALRVEVNWTIRIRRLKQEDRNGR